MENLKSLEDNEIWELVQLPKGRKAVGSKWVYKMKTDADRSHDYSGPRVSTEVRNWLRWNFCPVVALAVQYGLNHYQVDVTTAILNGELEEEIYIRQPQGFIAEDQEHLVCKLKKSIYGLYRY